jgi:hypothetical protein
LCGRVGLGRIEGMQTTATLPGGRKRDGSPLRHALSVVAVHDGFVSGIRAQEAVKWMSHSLGSEFQIGFTSWSFQKLERLDLRALSLRLAAGADVFIVSAADSKPLPDHVQDWLEASLKHRHWPSPVLVSLDDDAEGCGECLGPVSGHLQEVAARTQVELMRNEEFDRRLNQEVARRLVGQRQPAFYAGGSVSTFDHSISSVRWGINE